MPFEKSDKKTKKLGKFVALSTLYLASSFTFANTAVPPQQVASAPAVTASAPAKKERGAAKVKHKKSKRADKAISTAK